VRNPGRCLPSSLLVELSQKVAELGEASPAEPAEDDRRGDDEHRCDRDFRLATLVHRHGPEVRREREPDEEHHRYRPGNGRRIERDPRKREGHERQGDRDARADVGEQPCGKTADCPWQEGSDRPGDQTGPKPGGCSPAPSVGVSSTNANRSRIRSGAT
jgi:hypothetical protein